MPLPNLISFLLHADPRLAAGPATRSAHGGAMMKVMRHKHAVGARQANLVTETSGVSANRPAATTRAKSGSNTAKRPRTRSNKSAEDIELYIKNL